VTVYGKRIDERASKRTNEQAATFAQEMLGKLKAKPDDVHALVKEHSEDPGMKGGDPYTVAVDSPFVPEFKKLALRLNLNEVGIVKSQFGYHVMMRVTPPPPDPIESADILSRPAQDIDVEVLHILVGWKDLVASADERAKKRTKAEADKLAQEILAKVRAKGDMPKLMKEYSEDPGSKDTARAYEVSKTAQLVEPFKKLSLRLKEGEAGLVKTEFGWHIIKRVPPDALISTAILDRKTPAAKVKVKHILLGWTDANIGDPRGQKRTRAELEKLVKETLAKLAKGDKVETLMKELSEHKDSAESGKEFDIASTTQGLPPTFKNLSLRLNVKESGVVKSQFGIHIIQRVE
jgi:parvulin-like peptidyl-prolyl isomerase